MKYDVIVIGSGFGGAITACRLAEAGYKVLILERGRRWDRTTYPRGPGDAWLWNAERPERENGWIDLRQFPHMAVAQGAAVGGGSLIYANISCEAPAQVFEQGWPEEITHRELKPYYDAVARFMNVQRVPDNQWTERMKLMREAAEKIGQPGRFQPLELAVSFDRDWSYDQPDPFNLAKSRRFINAQGVEQGTCVHLGNCDIGCDVDAKNTLDRNYIAWAEKHHAEVRPLHLVNRIEPVDGGYRVEYDELRDGRRVPGREGARLVILAAGSLGSTELLLRCRDEWRSLSAISRRLGMGWSSNGDFLTPALHPGRMISPTRGPTISSAIDFLDGSVDGQVFWIEDGGAPDVLGNYLRGKVDRPPGNPRARLLVEALRRVLRERDPFQNVMPWFAQAVDAADGEFSLKRRWGFFGARRLHLRWDIAKSEAAIQAVVGMHQKLARATGGTPMVPPTWSLARDLITPHPLGGCGMGADPVSGVVNARGEVFGHRNLYVADAAIFPRAIGVNPSRTIGALAERIAAGIIAEGR
jgi:cholesterol oxidase